MTDNALEKQFVLTWARTKEVVKMEYLTVDDALFRVAISDSLSYPKKNFVQEAIDES